MKIPCLCSTLLFATAALVSAEEPQGIAFPGSEPGKAVHSANGSTFTLENGVISESWQQSASALAPLRLANKLSGRSYDQRGAELFRLALQSGGSQQEGEAVAIRLGADHVVVQVSRDGVAWNPLRTFPRAEFPGNPKLVRIGKMNLKAEAKDHYDRGPMGKGEISEISPAPPTIPSRRFVFETGAHQAAVAEYPFPAATGTVSCRINKGTDQGMSWAPALALIWEDGKKFLLVGLREKEAVFNVTTAAGEIITGASLSRYPSFDLPASAFRLVGQPKAGRLADRSAIEAQFVSPQGIHARWTAELRDGANYIRESLTLSSPDGSVPLAGVEFRDVRLPEAGTVGSCPGCPVAGEGLFLGVEMPGAQNAASAGEARIGFECKLTLSPAQSYSFGAVTGVAPEGQLRRAFLCYVEKERARPSKPFLHYNCWYDLGFGVDEAKMLDVAAQFDAELVKKRGVPVHSYLVDDGWDDPGKGLWVESKTKFPNGFQGMREKMQKLGACMGLWISPLGGYGGAKERTEWAQKMGLIPPGSGLDLAQPGYRRWFEERCLQLMREGGVNAFKWDKAGEGVSPHFMALLDVARNLRKQNPDLFVNVTVGTWPSPFWLNHIDSTWRNGSADVGWSGKGDDREKWLTFRDGSCYERFVKASPLYPLNSCMHHGIVHGRCFQGDKVGKSGANLKNEARSYFANGASLQELYITPSMMSSDAWDRVAEAAKWAQANADVLRDAHWVGGDPLKLEAYGYAAWSPRKGTLMIRNPDDQPQAITLDARTVLELPAGSAERYALRSPYPDQRVQDLDLTAGQQRTVALQPFEVLVFDAQPRTK
jgi:hypothetical protein